MSDHARLTVPADSRFIKAVLDFCMDFSEAAGLKGRRLMEARLGLEEAVLNVIEHGYAELAGEPFDIEMACDEAGMTYTIREQGIPFDPEALERDAAGTGSDPKSGLGLRLLHNSMDDVSFSIHGTQGKQTVLRKEFDVPVPPEEPTEAVDPGAGVPEDLEYSVRRMLPEEALEVSRLAWAAYGYTYGKLPVYEPAAVRAMNDEGSLVSYVAVTEDGEVMGHAAIVRYGDGVPELGVIFVKPKFRRRGCMERMLDAVLDGAKGAGLSTIFAQGVASHPFSQRGLTRYGFMPCVLRLACAPFREYKGIEGTGGRESFFTQFRYLEPRPAGALYAPGRHHAILKSIYSALGTSVSLSSAQAGAVFPAEPFAVSFRMDSKATATMSVERYGAGVVEEAGRRLREAKLERMEAVFLDLDLTDPLTPLAVEGMEDLGFFFAGVMPGGQGRDRLVLQYLNNVKLDYEHIKPGSDEAGALLEYVRGCAEKAGS